MWDKGFKSWILSLKILTKVGHAIRLLTTHSSQ